MTTNEFCRRVAVMREIQRIPKRLRTAWQVRLLEVECARIDKYLSDLEINSGFEKGRMECLFNLIKDH